MFLGGSLVGMMKAGTATPVQGTGLMLAVANSTTDASYSNDNGVTWTHGTQLQDNASSFVKMAASTTRFVWTASNAIRNSVQYTDDGIVFHTATMPSSDAWNAICYGGGLFVAGMFSARAGAGIATSPDGAVWTARNIGVTGVNIRALAYNGIIYVAMDDQNNSYTSPDGIVWTQHTSAGWGSELPNSLVWIGTAWVMTTTANTINSIYTSTDGITWTQRTGATVYSFASLVWNGTILLRVPLDLNAVTIDTSPDGIIWTQRSCPRPSMTGSSYNQYASGCWNGTTFCLANNTGDTVVSSASSKKSVDGIIWTDTGNMGIDHDKWGIAAQFLVYGTY